VVGDPVALIGHHQTHSHRTDRNRPVASRPSNDQRRESPAGRRDLRFQPEGPRRV